MATLLWDIDKAFPKSHDGTPAVRCKMNGDPASSGRCIKWTEDHNGNIVTRFAKLLIPEEKIEPINYDVLRESCDGEDPCLDLSNGRRKKKLENKLLRVYAKLGLNYLDAVKSVIVTPVVDTAAWCKHLSSNKEYVLINPYIVRYGKVADIAWVLRHEFMHRALYRGRNNLTNPELRNIVLDICINAILARDETDHLDVYSVKTCQWIYPPESCKNLLALTNCSITQKELAGLSVQHRKMWQEIYEKDRYNRLPNLEYVTPEDLYFRLKVDFGPEEKKIIQAFCFSGENPFGHSDNPDENILDIPNIGKVIIHDPEIGIPTERTKRLERDVRKSFIPIKYKNLKRYSNSKTKFWDQTIVDPEDVDNKDLAEYSKKIQTEKMIEDFAGNIAKNYISGTSSDLYPDILTDEGNMLAVIGCCPPKFPFYFNREDWTGRRRIVIFLDLSQSMSTYMAYIAGIAKRLEDIMEITFARNNDGEKGVLAFAGDVRELTEEEFADMGNEKILKGWSTSFDSVVEYCNDKIRTSDVDCILIFSDGKSSLTEENIRKFNSLGKKMYRVYFRPDTYDGKDVTSSLDELNGESTTLRVPKTDQKIV